MKQTTLKPKIILSALATAVLAITLALGRESIVNGQWSIENKGLSTIDHGPSTALRPLAAGEALRKIDAGFTTPLHVFSKVKKFVVGIIPKIMHYLPALIFGVGLFFLTIILSLALAILIACLFFPPMYAISIYVALLCTVTAGTLIFGYYNSYLSYDYTDLISKNFKNNKLRTSASIVPYIASFVISLYLVPKIWHWGTYIIYAPNVIVFAAALIALLVITIIIAPVLIIKALELVFESARYKHLARPTRSFRVWLVLMLCLLPVASYPTVSRHIRESRQVAALAPFQVRARHLEGELSIVARTNRNEDERRKAAENIRQLLAECSLKGEEQEIIYFWNLYMKIRDSHRSELLDAVALFAAQTLKYLPDETQQAVIPIIESASLKYSGNIKFPPSKHWFINGNNTMRVDLFINDPLGSEMFFDLWRAGYVMQGPDAMVKKLDNKRSIVISIYTPQIKEEIDPATGEVHEVKTYAKSMDDSMKGPAHVVMYSGHSGTSLDEALLPKGKKDVYKTSRRFPDKVMILFGCKTEEVHSSVTDRYDSAQIVFTTHWFLGLNAIPKGNVILEGIAHDLGWKQIGEDLNAVGPDYNGQEIAMPHINLEHLISVALSKDHIAIEALARNRAIEAASKFFKDSGWDMARDPLRAPTGYIGGTTHVVEVTTKSTKYHAAYVFDVYTETLEFKYGQTRSFHDIVIELKGSQEAKLEALNELLRRFSNPIVRQAPKFSYTVNLGQVSDEYEIGKGITDQLCRDGVGEDFMAGLVDCLDEPNREIRMVTLELVSYLNRYGIAQMHIDKLVPAIKRVLKAGVQNKDEELQKKAYWRLEGFVGEEEAGRIKASVEGEIRHEERKQPKARSKTNELQQKLKPIADTQRDI